MNVHGSQAIRPDLFLINGMEVVMPSDLTYTRSDLDSENSFRSITGELQRDRIAVKRKIDCSWTGLSGEELATILKAVDNIFFTVRFIDPYTNELETMVCYVGDRSPVTAFYNDKGEALYESFSCNFIEK